MRLYCRLKEKSRHKALVRLRHFEWSSKGLDRPHWCLSYCSALDTYQRSLKCFSGLTGSKLVFHFQMSDISQHSFYQRTQTMSDPQRCPIQTLHSHHSKSREGVAIFNPDSGKDRALVEVKPLDGDEGWGITSLFDWFTMESDDTGWLTTNTCWSTINGSQNSKW